MLKAMLALCLVFSTASAYAFPEAPFNALENPILDSIKMNAGEYDFEGIVKLSNCSGSVIRFTGQSLDDRAIVLTNGHCLGRPFLKPGEVVYKKQVRRRMRVSDRNMKFHRVQATELIYGTMTDTDSALYRLKETYRDLERLNIRPFELSEARSYEGVDIQIVSGYWERGYSCKIDKFVYILREAGWTFRDSIRYTKQGCRVIGGTSGSPIIQTGTRVVIGVNNTGNESGRRCTMNNPCEVDENDNIIVRRDNGYGQQTYQFYSCLTNSRNDIDLSKAGCKLPK